jgi:hypothetical protein
MQQQFRKLMQQQFRKLMQQQFRKLMQQQHTGSETAVQGREPEFNLKNTHTHTQHGVTWRSLRK